MRPRFRAAGRRRFRDQALHVVVVRARCVADVEAENTVPRSIDRRCELGVPPEMPRIRLDAESRIIDALDKFQRLVEGIDEVNLLDTQWLNGKPGVCRSLKDLANSGGSQREDLGKRTIEARARHDHER